jgi:hypothetical protein
MPVSILLAMGIAFPSGVPPVIRYNTLRLQNKLVKGCAVHHKVLDYRECPGSPCLTPDGYSILKVDAYATGRW